MTAPEVSAAVRDYLTHAGCATLEQIWASCNGATMPQVKAACRKLPKWVSVNRWDQLKQTVSTAYEARNYTARKLTMYRLPQ